MNGSESMNKCQSEDQCDRGGGIDYWWEDVLMERYAKVGTGKNHSEV